MKKNVNSSNDLNIQNSPQANQAGNNSSQITGEKQNQNNEQQNSLINQLNPNQKSMSTINQNTAYPNS